MPKKNAGDHNAAASRARQSGLRRRQKHREDVQSARQASQIRERAEAHAQKNRSRTHSLERSRSSARHQSSQGLPARAPMTPEEHKLLNQSTGNDPIMDAINRVDSRREQLIDTYVKDMNGQTGWDRVNARNKENIKKRLDHAKRLQFESLTGLAADPDHLVSEESLAIKHWAERQNKTQREDAEKYIQAIRQRAIDTRQQKQFQQVKDFGKSMQNPESFDTLQKSIKLQRQRKIRDYQQAKESRKYEQDEFIKRFEQKQRLRQDLLESEHDDETIEQLIQQDDRAYDQYQQDKEYYDNMGIDIDTLGVDGQVRPDLVRKKQLQADLGNDSGNTADAQGRDNTNEVKSLSQLNRTLNKRKQFVPKEKIAAVFNRVYDAIDKYDPQEIAKEQTKTLQDAEHNTGAREARLSRLRKELGLLPLEPEDSKDLNDEAYNRLNTGLRTRKQALATQLDKLQSQHDRDNVLLNKNQLRKKGGQVYAPILLEPPTDLHLYKAVEDAKDEVDTDELSVLQRHLGIRRSPETLAKQKAQKRRDNRKYRVLQHLRGRFVQKIGSDLVTHPHDPDRQIERNKLGLHHRRRLEVDDELNPDPNDTRSPEQRDLEERASIRSVQEIPHNVRHEIQARQIFGKNLLDLRDPAQAEMLDNFKATLHTHIEERSLVPTENRFRSKTPDPSNWHKASESEIAHLKPRLNYHVDPETGRRGFHLLPYTNKVVLPTVSKEMPESLSLPDGMRLNLNKKKLFETPFDYRLDFTRRNYLLQQHLRPKWEKEEGFSDDEQEDELLKLEATDNEKEFERAYGKEPTNYYSKVYHDVLGKSLVQQSHRFMHNVQALTYQRPLDRLLTGIQHKIPGLSVKGQPTHPKLPHKNQDASSDTDAQDSFDRHLLSKQHQQLDNIDAPSDPAEMVGPHRVKNRLGDKKLEPTITPTLKSQLSRSFSEFLPQLLQQKYSQHDYHSHKLSSIQDKQLQANVGRYTNNLQHIIQSKVFTPAQQQIYHVLNQNRGFGSNQDEYQRMHDSLEPAGHHVPKLTGLSGAVTRATGFVRRLYQRDGSGIELPLNQPLAKQTHVPIHNVPQSLQPYTSPIQQLKNARREHVLSTPGTDDSKLTKIQSKLDAISTPEIQDKVQQKTWLENKILSAPLSDHITSYISSSLPALSHAFRTTSAARAQHLVQREQDQISHNLPTSRTSTSPTFLTEHQQLSHANPFNVQSGSFPSQVPAPIPPQISPFQRSLASTANSPHAQFNTSPPQGLHRSGFSPQTASMLGIPQSKADMAKLINQHSPANPSQSLPHQPGDSFQDFLKSPIFDTTPKYIRTPSDFVSAVSPYLPSKVAHLFTPRPQRAPDYSTNPLSPTSYQPTRSSVHDPAFNNSAHHANLSPSEYAQQLSIIESEKRRKQRNSLQQRELPKFDAPDSFFVQQRGSTGSNNRSHQPQSVFDQHRPSLFP